MQSITATYDKRKNAIILTVPLQAPRLSSTGRSNIVADTGNFAKTGIQLDGREIAVKLIAITPTR